MGIISVKKDISYKTVINNRKGLSLGGIEQIELSVLGNEHFNIAGTKLGRTIILEAPDESQSPNTIMIMTTRHKQVAWMSISKPNPWK